MRDSEKEIQKDKETIESDEENGERLRETWTQKDRKTE